MGGTRRDYEGVRAASASSIEIDFYYNGERCRERLKLQPTPANLKRASQHRAAILRAIDLGEFDYPTTFPHSKNAEKYIKKHPEAQTLEAFLAIWLERKKKQLKTSTWRDYYNTVHHILIPQFGATPLGNLTRADVRKWCGTLEASNKRIANILTVLRSALNEAAEDELIESNPISGWTYSNREAPKVADDVDPFSAPEQAAIIQACSDPQIANMVQFLFWTGLRTSELIALNWSDIDWQRGEIIIARARTRYAQEDESTKTSSGRRAVKLLGPAREALDAQRQHTQLRGEHVFADPRDGKRWASDHAIWWQWQGICKRAKVRYRRPYQTRHTYASMLLTAGESPMWVAQQMGHSDWGMIRRVYGRWIPDSNPDAGSRAVELFYGQPLVSIRSQTIDLKDYRAGSNPALSAKEFQIKSGA